MRNLDEINRIKKLYRERHFDVKRQSIHSYLSKSALYIYQKREITLIKLLKDFRLVEEMNDKVVLDVGCGDGRVLRDFVKYGFLPNHLHGIDIVEENIERAKALNPAMNFSYADGQNLPYPDSTFDIVMQFTLFTSVLDEKVQRRIALEMLRVLKTNGVIIWYDIVWTKPWNKTNKGIGKRLLSQLFPGCKIHAKRVTLNPLIVRPLMKVSWILCELLEKFPFMKTHLLCIITKNNQI